MILCMNASFILYYKMQAQSRGLADTQTRTGGSGLAMGHWRTHTRGMILFKKLTNIAK